MVSVCSGQTPPLVLLHLAVAVAAAADQWVMVLYSLLASFETPIRSLRSCKDPWQQLHPPQDCVPFQLPGSACHIVPIPNPSISSGKRSSRRSPLRSFS